MEITDIEIVPAEGKHLKAYVTITLNHSFVIRDLKIIQRPTGYFVTMPKKKIDGSYLEIVSVINTESRKILEERILAEYQKMADKTVTTRKVKH
jgi:stage V sporulation protein G